MSHSRDFNTLAGGAEDDFALMERIARRDADALGRLYDRYATVVHSLCLRIVKDAGAAEEVTLDVFVEMWARADRYSAGRGSPVAYLMTLARSRALDRARVRARAGRGSAADAGVVRVDGAANPLASVIADERRSLIQRALERLDGRYREVLECAYFDGLSHSQIALKLGRPVGTVKTYLRRGLIQLRELLRNGGEGVGNEGPAPAKGIRDRARGADAASAPFGNDE
jgi:RNA polymerase sigma-70 factor (ECF subfamily)